MKKLAGAVLATCLMFGAISPARADLQRQLNDMFGSMVNATPPGVWETQRRGVVSGGSIVMRQKIMNENLVSFSPPRFNYGCGGLDLYAGSFSFANGQQFEQLFRNIGSGAAGAAFMVALDTMAPNLSDTLAWIQDRVQRFNELFSSGCQLGQGLFNDTIGAATGKKVNEETFIGRAAGIFDDDFDARSSRSGRSPGTRIASGGTQQAQQARRDKITVNLVWRALKDNSASQWFAGGDDRLLEAIMNLTGTVIVQDNGGDDDPVVFVPNQLTVHDLLFAGETESGSGSALNLNLVRCDEYSRCENPSNRPQGVPMDGLHKMIRQRLLGSSSSPGIVWKLHPRLSNGAEMTAEEKAFSTSLQGGIGGLIVQMSKSGNYDATESFARQVIPFLAYDMVEVIVRDLYKAVRIASSGKDHYMQAEFLKRLDQVHAELRAELNSIQQTYGPRSNVFTLYESLQRTMDRANPVAHLQ